MNYPNGIKKLSIKETDYRNRGMSLEDDINISNKYYLDEDIAIIHKKPTPIQVVDVDYQRNQISKAYFRTPSTTDYNGIYKGFYLDFEAKETRSKTSFSINNIHKHQIEHLKKVLQHKGFPFLIIRFTAFDETYLFEARFLIEYMDNNTSKSIPLNIIKKRGYLLENKYNPRIDYIKIVDKLLEGYK